MKSPTAEASNQKIRWDYEKGRRKRWESDSLGEKREKGARKLGATTCELSFSFNGSKSYNYILLDYL